MQQPNKPISIQRLVIKYDENKMNKSTKLVSLAGIYSNSNIKSIIIKDHIYQVKEIKSALNPCEAKKIVENVLEENDSADDVTVISSDDVIVRSNGTDILGKRTPTKKKMMILSDSSDNSSKTEKCIPEKKHKRPHIEKQSVKPKKRKKYIEKPSTKSKRQKTIKPIIPPKNTLLMTPTQQTSKKNKKQNIQAYNTEYLSSKNIETSIKHNVVQVIAWESVYKSTSFNAILPSGRVVSRDVWYTRIRSLGDDSREMSTNDCFVIKSDSSTEEDVFAHIVGFWMDEYARWMVTVLKYRKLSPDCLEGTADDGDISLNMFAEKCVVLTSREYSRYKTVLMRRSVGIGKYESFATSSLLSWPWVSNERQLLDCDQCRLKSFVVSGFF